MERNIALEQLAAETAVRPDELSDAFFSSLAERVEDAVLDSSRKELDQLDELLTGALHRQIRVATNDGAQAALGTSANVDAHQAFNLGRLAFAHLLVATLADHRVDDALRELAERAMPYLQALTDGEKTNVQLATGLKTDPAVVSRRLKVLREAGLTDFRKLGREVLNFLTPLARQSLEERDQSRGPVDMCIVPVQVSNEVQSLLDSLKQTQSPELQQLQNFGTGLEELPADTLETK